MAATSYGSKQYLPPEEHRAFFEEFTALMKRFPYAGNRFGLVDFGEKPERGIGDDGWECYPMGDWTVCDWHPPQE